MSEGDTCYYISETKEEYSDYQIVKPTCFQSGLWNASATLGLLSLRLAGIDTEKFLTPSQEEEEEGRVNHQKTILKRVVSIQSERKRRASTGSHSQSPPRKLDENPVVVDTQEDEEEEDLSLDPQTTAEVCNWQKEAQVGLQLLKYHGVHESKPVVKLSVVPKAHQPDHKPVLLPSRDSVATFNEASLGSISEDAAPDVVVVETVIDQKENRIKDRLVQKPHFELVRKSSSFLKLNSHGTGDSGYYFLLVSLCTSH